MAHSINGFREHWLSAHRQTPLWTTVLRRRCRCCPRWTNSPSFPADNGNRAIVAYLPPRRSGHFVRFKIRHAQNMARIEKALNGILLCIRIFFWDVPKFFMWNTPKHVVVVPIVEVCTYCWSNKRVLVQAPGCRGSIEGLGFLRKYSRNCWEYG